MRMAKTEELKQDIEILSQSYDRNVDRKDALIQVCPLLHDLQWVSQSLLSNCWCVSNIFQCNNSCPPSASLSVLTALLA